METILKTRIAAGLAYAQVEAHESACRFGFWDQKRSTEELVGLIHRDAAKILEIALAGNSQSTSIPDCTKLEEAVADVIIRCLDFSAGKHLHIAAAVLYKLEYNESLSALTKKDY